MSKKDEILNVNPNPAFENDTKTVVTSLLDVMKEGNEYQSIMGLQNVNVDLGKEFARSIKEITNIRKRPLVCYIANVVNTSITQSISINNTDDAPFLEMLRNVPKDAEELDILIVTPGGSAETVAFWVKQIRARFKKVSFILPYMSMSAGTIFCMSGDELIMDESAFFGPIDPQVPSKNGRYVPAQSINTLITDIQNRGQEQLKKGIQPDWTDVQILRNLDAKEIGNAINASKFSTDLVAQYLKQYKFKDWVVHQNGSPVTEEEREKRANEIAGQLCNHQVWLSHSNRISRDMASDNCRLKVVHPEEVSGLKNAIKRFWALACFTLEKTSVVKMFISDNYMLFRNETQK